MAMATPGWVPLLNGALTRAADVTSANGQHVSVTYTLVPGARGQLVDGLAEVVVYLYGPTAAAANNPSWRAGPVIRRKTWEKLLRRSDDGGYPELKTNIGEAFAWWHETLTPGVAYAQRPLLGTSMPVVDSLSLMECGTDHAVRGVQAKVYANRARPPVVEAFDKFERLQEGEFDQVWGDAVSRFEMEVRASGGPPFDPTLIYAGDQLLHFSVVVCHGAATAGDPAWDYHPRLSADPPHGRSVAYLEHAPIDDLVVDVADAITARVFT
jgi:hypothetical protein